MRFFRTVALLVLTLCPARAFAIRPFITDDARVVGDKLLQLETWFQVDRGAFQHWLMPAFGPTDFLEITIGMVHGAIYGEAPAAYSLNGPLVQAKFLFQPAERASWPGVAVAVGSLLPFGSGELVGSQGAFSYLALTENLGENERLLIHANIGISIRREHLDYKPNPLLGLGAQLRTVAGLHAVAEVAFGDAFTGEAAGVFQVGGRYIFNEHVQSDFTVGFGAFGVIRPIWGTVGLRLVTGELF